MSSATMSIQVGQPSRAHRETPHAYARGPGGIRTHDTRIKSPLLCRWSYGPGGKPSGPPAQRKPVVCAKLRAGVDALLMRVASIRSWQRASSAAPFRGNRPPRRSAARMPATGITCAAGRERPQSECREGIGSLCHAASRAAPRTEDAAPVVDLGVDRRREALAADAGEQVRGGHRGHLAARRARGRRDVGHDQAVVEADQRMVDRDRLRVGDVQGGGGDAAAPERVGERDRVDDRPARRVHEHRRRLHPAEPLAVDEAACVLAQVHVQRHEVGLGQQALEGHERRVELGLDQPATRGGGPGRGSASRSPSPAARPPGRSARSPRSRASRRGRPGPSGASGPRSASGRRARSDRPRPGAAPRP